MVQQRLSFRRQLRKFNLPKTLQPQPRTRAAYREITNVIPGHIFFKFILQTRSRTYQHWDVAFLLQCSLVFQPQPTTYTTDKSRIAFITSLVTGKAAQWATALWEKESPICRSYTICRGNEIG
uniref:DUF4939 domain-containing protein n=1 Tax=Gasterosteus aculeatus aculeatus TaxID=481459 RepID=A0AAQ4RK84_GASAC